MTQEKRSQTRPENPSPGPDVMWYEGYAITDKDVSRVDISDYNGDQIAMKWAKLNPFTTNICPHHIKEGSAYEEPVKAFIVFEVVNARVHTVYYWKFGHVINGESNGCKPIKFDLDETEHPAFRPKFEEKEAFATLCTMAENIAKLTLIPCDIRIARPHSI